MARVVFMGTPDFAAGILKALTGAGHEVIAAFTQPDRPKGRKGRLQMPPVKELALSLGIAVYQPERIRTPENVQLIASLRPDFIVAAAFGQIIPQSILDIPPYGCLNVHASLLPKWRGAAPIQWSILEGDEVTGVTIMRMNAGLDTGDMILKKEVPVREDETGDSLFLALMEAGAGLLPEAMEQILNGCAVYTPQPEESPTPYAKMLTRQSGLIDWSQGADRICRMVRAFDSWPGTFSFLNGKMLKILKAEEVPRSPGTQDAQNCRPAKDDLLPPSDCEAGTVVEASRERLTVQTGRGLVRILEVQPEGKKRMEAGAFLRGYPVQAKDAFRSER